MFQTIPAVVQEIAMKTFVLLLTLSLLAIPSAAGNAGQRDREDSSVSFSGTWKTIAGGAHQYTVTLEQIGSKVTGSYSPGNGKIFDGVVTGNKLVFKWTQDGGYEGTAVFTMDEDGKGFTGSSTALKPQEFTVPWSTYKPPVTSFAGTWETITNGKHTVILTMVQTGTKVTGIYPRGNGKLEGTVSGRVLRFKWQSDGGTGSGRLVMDESGKVFSGTYNKGDNPDDVENTWNGKLSAVADAKAPENVTPPRISFTGVWKALRGTTPVTLKLLQTGDQVIGQFQGDVDGSLAVSISEGIVVGNTLRFKFKLAPTDRDARGSGELVLAEDGKSFKGYILGLATTGTFVQP
jgi:hypothetical protein